MLKLHDDFGNTATIEEKYIIPFKGVTFKEQAFVLTISADYDDDFVYHLSVYETMEDLKNKLKEFSCNTWKTK